jgi:hypothetical protein
MDVGDLRLYVRRLLIITAVTIVAVFLASEAAFAYVNRDIDRAPKEVELVIPEGTAERVAAGEPVPGIPEEMIFVLGDVLVVRNEDAVEHEIGPVFVPPNTSASLPMDQADHYLISCSFSATNYLGLNVREPTTLKTRLLALLFAAPPTVVVAFFYSLAARPIGQDEQADAPSS